jgi:hypothetical protein
MVMWLAVLVSKQSWLLAETRAISAPEATAPSQLTVRLYGFAGISPSTIAMAEKEADWMLRDVHVRLNWLNCIPPMPPGSCLSEESPGDLMVRILAKAPGQTNSPALGMTSWGSGASALVFYDRVTMLQRYRKQAASILGRVLAHEIVHLLVPLEPHSDVGLMRSQWSPEDLDALSGGGLRLSSHLTKEAQRSILQRVVQAHGKSIE